MKMWDDKSGEKTKQMRCVNLTRTALLVGVAYSCSNAPSALGMSASDLDQLFAYRLSGVRVLPQFGLSFAFDDNIFFAGEQSEVRFIDLGPPQYRVVSQNGGYSYQPTEQSPFVPYQGFLQQQSFSIAARPSLLAASPLFSSEQSPPPPFQVPNNSFGILAGFARPASGYSTNSIFLQPKVSDFIGTVSPGIKLLYGSANLLSVSYHADIVRYVELGIAPPLMHRIESKFSSEPSRIKFEVGQSTAFLSTFLGRGQNLENRAKLVDRWTSNFDVRITYDTSTKTDLYLTQNFNTVDFSSGVNLYGTQSWGTGFGASYKPSEKTSFFAEVGYGRSTQIASSLNLPTQAFSQTYSGSVGIRGELTRRINGTVSAGYRVRDDPNTLTGSFGIPTVAVNINYIPRETTTIQLGYGRSTGGASQYAGQSLTTDNAQLTLTQLIGRQGKWSALTGINFASTAYGTSTRDLGVAYDFVAGSDVRVRTLREINLQRTDHTLSLNAGISYAPRRWLTTALNYNFEDYRLTFSDAGLQDVTLQNYTAHRIILSLNLGY